MSDSTSKGINNGGEKVGRRGNKRLDMVTNVYKIASAARFYSILY